MICKFIFPHEEAKTSSTVLQELPSAEKLISGVGTTEELQHQQVSRQTPSGTPDKGTGIKKYQEDLAFV